jgi:hypothetical protein
MPQTIIPANALRFAGDVSIEKVTLISSTGVYQNVRNQVIQIRVFEDIFSPFITGSIVIKDSFDFQNLLPLIGEEFLELKISTPTLKSGAIEGLFHVYKMNDKMNVGDRSIGYELNFISAEAVIDTNKKISKVFAGKISDIVGTFVLDKVDGLESAKKFVVENTRNTIKYVSPYWSPIKNLTFLADNSISETQSPSFLFFENRQGFNFRSLEKLYKGDTYHEFVMDKYSRDSFPLGGNMLNIMQDYKRIGEIEFSTSYDYMDRLRSGMYASKLISYDSTKKTYTVKNFDIKDRFSKQNHLNANPLYSSKVISRSNALHILFPRAFETFTSFGDTTNARILQERISFLKMAEAQKINISVPGRCDYTVGQVAEVTLYKKQPMKKNDRTEDLIDTVNSGKYLVSAINHQISTDGHTCYIELIKDSMKKVVK